MKIAFFGTHVRSSGPLFVLACIAFGAGCSQGGGTTTDSATDSTASSEVGDVASTTDANPPTDSSTASDTTSHTDASPSTDSGSATDANSPIDVANILDVNAIAYPTASSSCADLATYCAEIAAVTDDTDRTCLYEAYISLCATGNTTALQSAFRCVINPLEDTGDHYCWTFSDPNSATPCLSATLPSSSALTALMVAIDAKCGYDAGIGPNDEAIPYLTDSTATSITTCINAAGDCTAATACFSANSVTAPFVTCGLFQPPTDAGN